MQRIIGLLISGFAVRAMGAGLALYVAMQGVAMIRATFGAASPILTALGG